MIRAAQDKFHSTMGAYYFNCVGCALYELEFVGDDKLGLSESDRRTLKTVAEAIEDYANSIACESVSKAVYIGNGLNGRNITLASNQYLIGVRVIENKNYGSDYHVVAQTSEGKWVNKHGSQPEIEKLGYINPDDDDEKCWTNSSQGCTYDSDTAYIIITKK